MLLREVLNKTDNNSPEVDWKKVFKGILKTTASFIIPTYNSENSILYVLEGIDKQLLKTNIKEIIVIDDGSTDNTKRIIDEFLAKTSIKLIYRKNDTRKYAAYSRNKGLRLATGDVVCFIDSDIIIPPDYLNYHLYLHEKIPNVIGLSLRSFIEKEEFTQLTNPFPIKSYINEFRLQKTIKPEWCDTEEKRKFAGKTIELMAETNNLKNLGMGSNYFWSLPEICLTCAITYKRSDLLTVKGAPSNFVGWGFNDVSMAAKVISLKRYVIPVMNAGVYHLNHPKRSGDARNEEFKRNSIRYQNLLNMEQASTFKYFIPDLEIC